MFAFNNCFLFVHISWLIDFLLRSETSSLDIELTEFNHIPQYSWIRKLMRMRGMRLLYR